MSSSNHNIYTNSTGKISIGSQDTKECYVQNGYLYLSGSSGDFTGSTMAVNKEYVDSVASGLDVKDSVRVASTGNVDLANDVYNGVTLDGVVLSTGDRVLLKDQTTGSENGIYIVGANAAAIARSPDMDDNAEVTSGLFTFVESGSSNADAGFVLTTDGSITVGTTAIAFSQFSGAGSLNAGTGISKSGNTFNIDSDQAFGTVSFTGGVSANGGITVDTNKFIVADTTGNTTIAGTLDVTGDTSVSTLDSSGATSLATGGAAVAINASGSMTTVKGTLNVDEAATFDTTVGITGDLTVDGGDIVASTAENAINIFATTTGKTTLGGGAVDVGATGTATTIKGTLNVDEAVTLDTTLTVTGTTTMNGAVTLGDASTDDVVVTGSLASHLVPKTDSTYNLGSSSIAFTNAYVDNIVSVSDRRLKENIKDQNLGLDFINKLRPVSYNMIDDDDKKVHNGLIAQEVEEVLAESGISLDETSTVMYNSEADKYRMNYIEFVSPLIKSVQELKAENDSLKQTNDALLARLEALEAKVNN